MPFGLTMAHRIKNLFLAYFAAPTGVTLSAPQPDEWGWTKMGWYAVVSAAAFNDHDRSLPAHA